MLSKSFFMLVSLFILVTVIPAQAGIQCFYLMCF
jgi:hypothetical protein